MKPKIITISREYGSGGGQIGREVARILGIDFYEKEIINTVARESGLSQDLVEELDGQMSLEVQDRMHEAQAEVIRNAAANGPCVIVGRAANYVLADRSDCLHTFVYADLERRVRRVMERLEVSEEEAREKIERVDGARAAYYFRYTGEQWGLAKKFNLALDSSTLGVEGCVKAVLSRVPPEWKPHEVRAC